MDDEYKTKSLEEAEKQNHKCILCGEHFEGMGNNPQPLSDGRCCDKCSMERVIPARLQQKKDMYEKMKDDNIQIEKMGKVTANELKEFGFGDPNFDLNEFVKERADMSEEEQRKSLDEAQKFLETRSAEKTLKHFSDVSKAINIKENVAIISENDRLYAYQVLRNVIFDKFSSIGAEDFLEKSKMGLAKAVWRTAYMPSFNNAKIWNIDDDQMPMIMHSDTRYDEHLPFPSIILNCLIPIKHRIYYGAFVGSFYTEDYKYRLLMSVYKEIIRRNDKEVEVWGMEFFPIDNVANEDFGFTKPTYYQKRLKNFIFSFCNYIHEPEVTVVEVPVNPNNNKHRIQRGKLPLPPFKKTVVHGGLQIHIKKMQERIASIRANNQREVYIRGMYMHFRNKQRYRRLYAIPEVEIEKAGFSIYNGVIRKWKKPQVRNKGKTKIKQEWEVK